MLLNTLKLTIAGALLLFTSTSTYAQLPVDGFYPKKGDFTFAPGYTYKTYDSFYVGSDLQGLDDVFPGVFGDVNTSILSLYGQYAITDRISATATLPYIVQESDVEPTTKVDGFQDLGLYVKGRIYEKAFSNSSKFNVGAALGFSTPISDYEDGGLVSIGNQATNYDGEVILHYESPYKVFVEATAEYSIRENSDLDVPNALLYSAKIGYLHQYFYAHIELDIQDSVDGTDIGGEGFGGAPTLPETEVDYTNLNFTIYVPVYKDIIGVSANAGLTLDGRNFSEERGVGFGLVYNGR